MKEMITSRSRLHPHIFFGENFTDIFDVRDHVDLDLTGGGEIKIHTEIVMFMTADNVEFFYRQCRISEQANPERR